MREIVFKAKTPIERRWVQGIPVNINGFDYILKKTRFRDYNKVRIDDKTICEWTGEYDYNCNKLYTDDVVKFNYDGRDRLVGVIKKKMAAYVIECKELSEGYVTLHELIRLQHVKENSILSVATYTNIHDEVKACE